MNDVYFIRHGENPANLTKEFSWLRVDYSLTPKGRLQAEQAADALTGLPVEAVYSSPLKRARETATIIAARLGKPLAAVMEEFRETHVGDFELLPPSAETWDAHNRLFEAWMNGRDRDKSFPNGETFYQTLERMQCGLKRILKNADGRTLVVVGHGGQMALTMAELCDNITSQEIWTRDNHNCSITHARLETAADGQVRGRLVKWADYSHLHGEAAQLVMPYPTQETTFARA